MKLTINLPDSSKEFDVVGMGHNAIDHLIVVPNFPQENTKSRLSHYEIQGGGQLASGLSALSRFGVRSRYLGKIGDDWQGNLALQKLTAEGIDASCVIQVPDTPNLFSFIIVNNANGHRTILSHYHPNLMMHPGDFPREAVTAARILYLDGTGEDCALQAAQWAREEGMVIVMDVERMKPRIPEMLYLADVVITSENFANEQCPEKSRREFLEWLHETYNIEFCGVTLGEKGSLGLTRGMFFEQPSFPVEVVDTTGAGDVYHAGFIYGMLQQWDIPRIMQFAGAAAALKCRHLGGRKGAPTLEEVNQFLASAREG